MAKKRGRVLMAGSGFKMLPGGTSANAQFYNYLRGQGLSAANARATANARYPKKRKKTAKRKRVANPFKVFIRAVPKRGPKTVFWFNGKHMMRSAIGRASFSSVGNATVMAKHLIRKWPILKKYDVELWSKVT